MKYALVVQLAARARRRLAVSVVAAESRWRSLSNLDPIAASATDR